jgi:fibronectin type 3 domain-containing protein
MKRILMFAPFAVLVFLLILRPVHTSGQTALHGSFLTWNAPSVTSTTSAAASYNIYRGTVSGGPYTLVANVTTTSYTDPVAGLSPGVTYFYVVRSVNIVGVEEEVSAEVSGTIPNAPGAVTALADVVK